MTFSEDELYQFWDELLSRQPQIVKQAFARIPKKEQKAVLAHLKDMAKGEGWQPGQRDSARAALDFLIDIDKSGS
jgi:hypothetical protein